MLTKTVCALLVLSSPALATYSIDLVAPGGGSTITLPTPPTSEQIFDIAVYVNADGPGEVSIGAEMRFGASTPNIGLRGMIGSSGLSGEGTRYNDLLFDIFDDPNFTASCPLYPEWSGLYGAVASTGHNLPGRNLLGFVSLSLLPGTPAGIYTFSTLPYYSDEPGPILFASWDDSGSVFVPRSTISFEVLPEPAAGLLLVAALPFLRRRGAA
jgi:hypothetical protein